jgi:hypothetical protein
LILQDIAQKPTRFYPLYWSQNGDKLQNLSLPRSASISTSLPIDLVHQRLCVQSINFPSGGKDLN